MRRMLALLALTIATAAAAQQLPPEAAIRDVLKEHLGADPGRVAIVVGIIEPAGRRIVSYGAKEIDARSIFEIGPITKVFTSLLLADAARRGEVKLNDPIAKYLPPGVKVLARTGTITLQDLATDTSGLPALPSNLARARTGNPFAGYTTAMLYEFLSTYEQRCDPGTQYGFSYLGGALLGDLLARRAGTSYETLIRSRILEPLGMNDTSIKLSESQQQRLAVGYDQQRRVAPNWDASPFAGAAALHSDAGDLLTLLSAYLGYTKSPLAAAMTSQVAVRRPTGIPTLDAALGWVVLNHNGQELVCLNGGTDGYHTYIAYDAKRRAGVVVLTNSTDNLADIGQQFLTQP